MTPLDEIERAYNLHAQDVYKYLFSLSRSAELSEELTQETFCRAMRTIKTYDGSCKLSVWLCQIAKHVWYQWLDKQTRQKRAELTDDIPYGVSTERETILRAEKIALYKAIHTLLDVMREVVHMRLTGEFSFAEIGGILNKSENWARTTFYRAKQKIIDVLKEE